MCSEEPILSKKEYFGLPLATDKQSQAAEAQQ